MDESEAYILGNNNLLLLVENIDSISEIIESQNFAKRVDQLILKELKTLVKTFLATGTVGSIVTERQERGPIKMQSSSLELTSYPNSLSLNQINKHGVVKVALALQTNINFSIGNVPMTGVSNESTAEPSKRSNHPHKPLFHLANHVFYFKSWEGQAAHDQVAIANNNQDNNEMIQEEPEIEVIDMEDELRQPRGPAEANRHPRNRKQPKSNELLRNLDSLNISDNLKAKFLHCLKTGESKNGAPPQ